MTVTASIARPSPTSPVGGEMGACLRALDWATSPLGAPASWPRALAVTVTTMLESRFPMWLVWGPESTFLCNDAFAPCLGAKRDWAIGAAGRMVFAEVWHELAGRLDRLFAIAKSRHLDVDLHVDENGSPASRTLLQIAEAVLRSKFQGQVVCGHCCSLAMLTEEHARHTIAMATEANLKIVSLPLVNQYLQGRLLEMTPRWRGVTHGRPSSSTASAW